MTPTEELQHLCGRRAIAGRYWEHVPSSAKEINEALEMGRGNRTQYHLRIRQDAIEAYEAARERARKDEDGNPVNFRAPDELGQETHRLEDLFQTGACNFKLASKRGMERPHPKAGYRFVSENIGVRLAADEALPCSLADAVSLLNRYPMILEPFEAEAPKPVKIERESNKSSGRKRSRVKHPEA